MMRRQTLFVLLKLYIFGQSYGENLILGHFFFGCATSEIIGMINITIV